ncbi:MAG: squalene--hopene cyclase [Deltaproteobacteria bacterium]|nr:squalene--hopene cyclase [Deltaproteobacteria bacterium]
MSQKRDIDIGLPLKKAPPSVGQPPSTTRLTDAIALSSEALLNLQQPEGYWWFTLEANEAISAGYIQLLHYLGAVDSKIQKGVINRILQAQREDGSWGLYYSAPGDLSTTVECYFSLKLAGFPASDPALIKARKFILSKGGLTQIRVFSRIHLALFGLIEWKHCPVMPIEIIFLPPWAPMNIYHFSSWARASIVPLLVVFNQRRTVKVDIDLEELYAEPLEGRHWKLNRKVSPLSIERIFILMDRGLKYVDKIPFKPWRRQAVEKCIDWVWEHMQKTEDIYPALAYGAMAFKAAGYANDSIQIQTALKALKSFQQKSESDEGAVTIHQQCCISPVWDTPWSLVALIEAGLVKTNDPRLLKSGRWLLSKEVTNPMGDWRFKNSEGEPGGWSFEFKNEYFPDVDDTVEVLTALQYLEIPEAEKRPAMQRALNWLLSMQNDDGGWGAFDKNNDLDLVNKIPFSDHGACLDPSTPDLTGRVVEYLLKFGLGPEEPPVKKALKFLKNTQEKFGGWYGRWAVNYIFGTWCVLTAFEKLEKNHPFHKQVERACRWLFSIQNEDGGFSESPESYVTKRYTPYPESVASQTAWGVMALISGGHVHSIAVQKGIEYLLRYVEKGDWDEKYFTGTGFPGHFYIRYHGYRYFFPLLALARYQQAIR